MRITSSIIASQKGFTIVELIVGMAIFSIGMTGILALLHTTIENSLYSRHEIVAANLLREQVELVTNLRNTNIRNLVPFDRINSDTTFGSGEIYIIENNFFSTGFVYSPAEIPVTLSGITLDFTNSGATFTGAQLFLDPQGRYTHKSTATGTSYAAYTIIRPLTINGTSVKKDGKNQGYTIDARVLVKDRSGYKEYDLKTVLTDWKR